MELKTNYIGATITYLLINSSTQSIILSKFEFKIDVDSVQFEVYEPIFQDLIAVSILIGNMTRTSK